MRPDPVSASGYPTDVIYPRVFYPSASPAWLDFVALLSGFAPPSRKAPISWCELGCAQGLTAAIFAATHPESRFYGIDLMPAHIDSARRFCDRAGISNLSL